MRRSVYLAGTANNGRSGIGTCPVLEHALLQLNYKIANSPDSDFLINLNHNPRSYKEFIKFGGSPENSFLVLLEPKSVYPAQYKPKNLARYKLKISPGNPKFNFLNEDFIGWPYTFNINPSKPVENEEPLKDYIKRKQNENVHNYESWAKRRINCSMIAANKVSASKENQYGLRRYFAKNLSPETLEVFGPLWIDSLAKKIYLRIITYFIAIRSKSVPNISSCYGNLFWKYPTARGIVMNKHNILRESKFSLVIENSQDYVSEKLFDSIINGAVPIYFGPELSTVGLPSSLAIQINSQMNSVEEVIFGTNPENVRSMLQEMQIFLQSQKFHNSWTLESVYTNIAMVFHRSMRPV